MAETAVLAVPPPFKTLPEAGVSQLLDARLVAEAFLLDRFEHHLVPRRRVEQRRVFGQMEF